VRYIVEIWSRASKSFVTPLLGNRRVSSLLNLLKISELCIVDTPNYQKLQPPPHGFTSHIVGVASAAAAAEAATNMPVEAEEAATATEVLLPTGRVESEREVVESIEESEARKMDASATLLSMREVR
jgi:hypothetical protein